MRKPIIAANWKMNKRMAEVKAFMQAIAGKLPPASKVDTVICAPFVHLPVLTELAQGLPLRVGAQNMYVEESGAFTGEISPVMLTDIGVEYVIIGHSERRAYFHEDDQLISRKVQAAHQFGLTPIICVGEDLAVREAGKTNQVIKEQVEQALAQITREQVASSIIAYEPIWAIGTGKSASPAEANEVCAYIRTVIEGLTDSETAEAVRIQYGGSVNGENIGSFLAQKEIDGALVGGASLEPDSFLQLLEGQQA